MIFVKLQCLNKLFVDADATGRDKKCGYLVKNTVHERQEKNIRLCSWGSSCIEKQNDARVYLNDPIKICVKFYKNYDTPLFFLISYQPQTKSEIHNIVIPAKAGNHTSHAESPVYGSPPSRGRRGFLNV